MKFIPVELGEDLQQDMPRFFWHENTIDICGHAKPEFAPLSWQNFLKNFSEFLKDKKSIIVNFKLEYYNSASSRFITEMFVILTKNYKLKPIVNWYYFKDDEDSVEDAEIYQENYPKIKVKLIQRD
jgi:hypothetical protein